MSADQYLARFSCHHKIYNSPLDTTVMHLLQAGVDITVNAL